MKKEIQFCVFVVYVIVWFRVSETYTNCLKLATGKLHYGYTCIQSSECQTEYCINAACSCPDVSFLDEETGLCARKSGHIFARNEECGYIVSTGDIPFGTLRQWNITGEPETYVTLVILEFSNCNNNYVDVIEDSRIKSRTQCTTGDFTDKYHASKSNHITVNYRGTTAGDKGFRAIYFIRNNSAVLTEPTGYIASPGYPTDYGGYREYTLLIRAKQGQLIRLSPVGSTSFGNAYVHVYDGQYTNMTVLNNLTDQCTLKYYTSTSNYMLVKFTLSFFSQGFSGSYKIFA
ncbi:deleted in malignant brain tumors 1 protein, partial [Biomphalaria glabrata]